MAYESAPISRYKARYNSDNDDNEIICQLVRNGVKVTPASATITIYAPGNSTALVSAAAMTVSGTLMTYEMDTTTVASWPVGTGYRADIVVTDSNSVTYDEHVYFDVVNNVPQGKITRDQLLKLDERVMSMQHAGDSDFSELINGVWEEVQLDIESRTIDGDQMLDDMVVDRSRLSVAARFLCLARLLRPKGHSEDANYYEDTYTQKLRQIMSGGIKHDVDQDQEEDESGTPANMVRLVN